MTGIHKGLHSVNSTQLLFQDCEAGGDQGDAGAARPGQAGQGEHHTAPHPLRHPLHRARTHRGQSGQEDGEYGETLSLAPSVRHTQ